MLFVLFIRSDQNTVHVLIKHLKVNLIFPVRYTMKIIQDLILGYFYEFAYLSETSLTYNFLFAIRVYLGISSKHSLCKFERILITFEFGHVFHKLNKLILIDSFFTICELLDHHDEQCFVSFLGLAIRIFWIVQRTNHIAYQVNRYILAIMIMKCQCSIDLLGC